LCDLASQRVRLDEVRERPLAVDLDDRDPLVIARLELVVAGDVDFEQIEVQLLAEITENPARRLAEMAALGCVKDDRRNYG
jgi:hypothetical protein